MGSKRQVLIPDREPGNPVKGENLEYGWPHSNASTESIGKVHYLCGQYPGLKKLHSLSHTHTHEMSATPVLARETCREHMNAGKAGLRVVTTALTVTRNTQRGPRWRSGMVWVASEPH